MQKTERAFLGPRLVAVMLLGMLSLSVSAQTAIVSSGVKSSIQTVDELIKMENAEVLIKSRPVALPSSVTSTIRVKPVAPTIRVTSIYGSGDVLRTDLQVNQVSYMALHHGAVAGSCVVKEIANKCVVLAPISAKTPADMCPKSCWTGEPPVNVEAVASAGVSRAAGQPMPTPLPMGSFVPAPR
jgi:hypothetical protein